MDSDATAAKNGGVEVTTVVVSPLSIKPHVSYGGATSAFGGYVFAFKPTNQRPAKRRPQPSFMRNRDSSFTEGPAVFVCAYSNMQTRAFCPEDCDPAKVRDKRECCYFGLDVTIEKVVRWLRGIYHCPEGDKTPTEVLAFFRGVGAQVYNEIIRILKGIQSIPVNPEPPVAILTTA